MSTHKHDTNGRVINSEIRVGPEIITYFDTFCTCGKLMTRHTIDRRPAK